VLLNALLSRTEFASYEEFVAHYRVNVPAGFNFGFDVVDALAAGDPGRRALVWCNDAGEARVFTMDDMARGSARAAGYFRSLGIVKGDRVMLILKRRYEYWQAVIGLHKLGAVAIPATHQLMKKDLVYRIRAAGVKMIVAVNDPGVRAAVDAAVAEAPVPLLARLGGGDGAWHDFTGGVAAAPDTFARPTGPAAAGERDPMLLYFTSGTTGMPKMVLHNHLYPLGHILTARYWQDCRPGGLHLTVAETGWAKASWGKLYGQWIAGSAVMVYDFDRFVPKQLLDVMVREGVTTFCAPPTMYRYFIREPLHTYDWSRLRHAVVAGEPLNPEVFAQFKAATGLELREGYGQTEMTVAVGTFPWLAPRPGSMGKPAPGYAIDIVDETGRSCEVGSEGEIVVRTAQHVPLGMFDGYLGEPERTAGVWHDGVYHTGDVAWRDADGYLWFVGRTDDVIKSSGYRIGPFEVESALQEHPAVLECAVTGVPDPERGAVVKASIVLAKGHAASEALQRELQEHVKRTTAPYKYPRIIEFVAELPKTVSGKIRRVEIRGRDGRGDA
jgi:acetyl-CoA synthetase